MTALSIIFKWAIISGSFILPELCFSQLNILSFQKIEKMQTDKPKNTVIFIYTDWCNYCKAMENTTFKHKKIIDKLNNEYYFTMLNAEEKQDIKFCGKTFHFKPTGTNTGIQELAEALANIDGKVSYPTLVILNSKNEIIFQHSNFLNSSEMILILEKIYH